MYFRGMGLHKYYANALTMGNLLSGVLVIIGLFIWPFGAAVNGNLTGESFSEYGALAQGERGWGMLALAMIWMAGQMFDLLDGIVARWTRTEGPMGLQLDSIADAVSSGVTPAIAGIMFLHAWAPAIPAALKFLPLTMAMAATWRLARFNVEYAAGSDGTGFRGMPAPAGALWWIGILLTAAQYEMFGSWGLYGIGGMVTVVASVFIGSTLIPWWMISDRPMMDLKGWGKTPEYDRKRIVLLVALVIVGIVVAIFGRAFGLGLQAALLLYAFFGKFIQPNTTHS
jgi:CDP-diacylglycerol--serine O-phosphatidyltransferase